MTMTLRAATRADAEAIAALNAVVHARHAEAFPWLFKPQGFSADSIAKLIDREGALIFLAGVNRATAGYIYAEIQRVPEGEITYAYNMLCVHHLSVHARFRRMGIARALVDHVAEIARREGVERVGADYWSFNSDPAEFFARYGLAPYRVRVWR